jgi:hypothetical protein
VQNQVSLAQLRVRVDMENSKRNLVLDRLEKIVGKDVYKTLRKGSSAQVLHICCHAPHVLSVETQITIVPFCPSQIVSCMCRSLTPGWWNL